MLRLIADTSVFLLAATFLASMLHLLFEFLAFRSDISFWQSNKSLAGLSTRAVVTDLLSQLIVFLFLVESDASLLITVPSFFGILIQAWKVGCIYRNCVGTIGFYRDVDCGCRSRRRLGCGWCG